MLIRCFCPPLSLFPDSPTILLYPFSVSIMKSCACATFAALCTSSIEYENMPKAIFSLKEVLKRMGCWLTIPISFLSSFIFMSRISMPSMRMLPLSTSMKRGIRSTKVDLPPPDLPTKASVCPFFSLKLISFRTGSEL